ncbi:MAG: lysozyme [Acidithiobacillus sp.]
MNFINSSKYGTTSLALWSIGLFSFLFASGTQAINGAPINCSKKKLVTYERNICSDDALRLQDRYLEQQYADKKRRLQDANKNGTYENSLGVLETAAKKLFVEIQLCPPDDKICVSDAYAKTSAIVGGCFTPNNKCEEIPSSNPGAIQASKAEIFAYNKDHLKMSPYGIDYLTGKEAISLCLYNDMANIATIGIGHVVDSDGHRSVSEVKKMIPPKLWLEYKDGITIGKARQAKLEDVQEKVKALSSKITVKLNQCQMDAVISLAFNAGPNDKENLWKLINGCEWDKVPAKMAEWNKARDPQSHQLVVSTGLVNRRREEGEMFLKCKYALQKPQNITCVKKKTTRMDDGRAFIEEYMIKEGQSAD